VCKKVDVEFSTICPKMSENRRLQGGGDFLTRAVDRLSGGPLNSNPMPG